MPISKEIIALLSFEKVILPYVSKKLISFGKNYFFFLIIKK